MQNQTQTPKKKCEKIRRGIEDLRQDLYIAVSIDDLVKYVNESIRADVEMRGAESVEITKEDVKMCIKYDDSIKVVETRNGKEVLWLWHGYKFYEFMHDVAEIASKYSDVTVWYKVEEEEEQ